MIARFFQMFLQLLIQISFLYLCYFFVAYTIVFHEIYICFFHHSQNYALCTHSHVPFITFTSTDYTCTTRYLCCSSFLVVTEAQKKFAPSFSDFAHCGRPSTQPVSGLRGNNAQAQVECLYDGSECVKLLLIRSCSRMLHISFIALMYFMLGCVTALLFSVVKQYQELDHVLCFVLALFSSQHYNCCRSVCVFKLIQGRLLVPPSSLSGAGFVWSDLLYMRAKQHKRCIGFIQISICVDVVFVKFAST